MVIIGVKEVGVIIEDISSLILKLCILRMIDSSVLFLLSFGLMVKYSHEAISLQIHTIPGVHHIPVSDECGNFPEQ